MAEWSGIRVWNLTTHACVLDLPLGAIRCGGRAADGALVLALAPKAFRASHTALSRPSPRSIAKMLFCTSLVAFVGAGEQPHLTPRKLTLLNSHSNSVIQALSFPAAVLGVHLNRKRCGGLRRGIQLRLT